MLFWSRFNTSGDGCHLQDFTLIHGCYVLLFVLLLKQTLEQNFRLMWARQQLADEVKGSRDLYQRSFVPDERLGQLQSSGSFNSTRCWLYSHLKRLLLRISCRCYALTQTRPISWSNRQFPYFQVDMILYLQRLNRSWMAENLLLILILISPRLINHALSPVKWIECMGCWPLNCKPGLSSDLL